MHEKELDCVEDLVFIAAITRNVPVIQHDHAGKLHLGNTTRIAKNCVLGDTRTVFPKKDSNVIEKCYWLRLCNCCTSFVEMSITFLSYLSNTPMAKTGTFY